MLLPRQQAKLARGAKDEGARMSQTDNTAIAVIGINIARTRSTSWATNEMEVRSSRRMRTLVTQMVQSRPVR